MARQTFEQFTSGITPKRISFEEFSGGSKIKIVEPKSEPEKLSFLQRVGQDLKKRVGIAEEISDAVSSGEQSFAEGVLQIAGKVGVGGTFDLIQQGLTSVFRALPDAIEQPIRDAGSAFLQTKIAQKGLSLLGEGMDVYNEWKAENPRAARNVEAVVDIGLMFAPVKAKPKAVKPTAVGKLGKKAIVSAKKTKLGKQTSFIDDLVRPSQTKKVREAQVGKTLETSGILRQKKIIPSIAEKSIAKEVAKIPNISKSKTLQGNYNIIAREVSNTAKKLEKDIKVNDFIFPKKEFLSELNLAKTRLVENPLIVGDAQKVAAKLIDQFERIITKNKNTGSGLLKSRKEFDNWMRNQKGGKVFDPANENALTTAIKEIRQTANSFLNKKATNVAVKESLSKQSTLYRALDNIKPKAANEASNIIARAWQNASRVLTVKSGLTQSLALLAGIGGLGAAAVFAPFMRNLLFGIGAFYLTGRAILAPNTRKFLGKLLEDMDTLIRKTKIANIIKELRSDRALRLEILEQADDQITEKKSSN